MEWIKKCPVLFLLIVSGLILTIVGLAGKNTIYKEYEYNFLTTPLLALPLEGMERGQFPAKLGLWKSDRQKEVVSGSLNGTEEGTDPNGFAGQSIEMFEESGLTDTDNDIGGGEAEGVKTGAEEENGRTYSFQTVTEEYFEDAVFIGDSRTVGLFEYSGLAEKADFYAKISLTIYDVFTDPFIKEETGDKITIEEALLKKQYGKVYLMLGINELGTGTVDTFMQEYVRVIEKLQKLQPEAVIFAEGIMRVTGTKNEADPIFNNTNINIRNEAIAKLTDGRNIFYIDVNEVVCDEQGNLREDYTTDEVHLKAQYYQIWKEFLMEHGIERDGE